MGCGKQAAPGLRFCGRAPGWMALASSECNTLPQSWCARPSLHPGLGNPRLRAPVLRRGLRRCSARPHCRQPAAPGRAAPGRTPGRLALGRVPAPRRSLRRRPAHLHCEQPAALRHLIRGRAPGWMGLAGSAWSMLPQGWNLRLSLRTGPCSPGLQAPATQRVSGKRPGRLRWTQPRQPRQRGRALGWMVLGRVRLRLRGLVRLPARLQCGQAAALEIRMRVRAPGCIALLGIQCKSPQ